MSLMNLFKDVDAALTDLDTKKTTLATAKAASADVTARADAAYRSALDAAVKTRTDAVASADTDVTIAAKAYTESLGKAQVLKRQFDEQFSGLSTGDSRVRVS